MNIGNKIKRAIACAFIQEKRMLNLTQPIVSFTFDDVPDSGLINGSRILKNYGYSGTYYVALGLTDTHRRGRTFNDSALLRKIAAEGGELACHTHSHLHLYSSEKEKIIADLLENQEKVKALIPGYTFSNFSYPYGEQTMTSKRIIRNRYKSARSIKRGINQNPIDLNNLKAVELMENFDPLQVVSLIDRTIDLNAWLILYTHDIDKKPSSYGCSPEYFESIVQYCFEKKIKVLTVDKALDSIWSG